MSTLRTFEVRLITRGYFIGEIEAASETDAVARTFDIWCNVSEHPFEQDDHELISVTAEAVRS
ncbi:MAG: hypothetical protein ABL904_14275 [Hyphomicrobiaceae bacterium]